MTEQFAYDLFISYAEEDKEWVEGYLLDGLEKSGVRCYSEAAFALGVPRLLEFERGVKQSQRILLIISPAYLADGSTQFIDILAGSRSLETSTWPVIPVIRHQVQQLPPRLAMLTCLQATNETEQQAALEKLCQELQRPLRPVPKPPCPYPGMRPFRQENHQHFFGRDLEIDEIIRCLRLHPFLTVIGPSGSGKSSLVFAGLLPKLTNSGLFGSGSWVILDMRPGESPLNRLQTLLDSNLSDVEMAVRTLLTIQKRERFLLIVDQFEELFTLVNTQEVEPFQSVLKQLIQTPDCYVILTVRADFYGDLMLCSLWPEIQGRRLDVLPLDEKGLKQAIKNPAEVVGVYVESALLERLLADASGEPGVLPLLQETLVLLWERIERRFLPLSAYEQLTLVLSRKAYGKNPTGLQVAIANLADNALASLTNSQQAITRRILLRLVQFNQGRADTRRQQPIKALQSIGDDPQNFQETLNTLTRNRLLTLTSEDNQQSKKVDISHEALITGWAELQQWIQERRSAEQIRRRLDDKAKEWARLGKESGGLLDDIELGEAEQWLSSPDAKELGYGEDIEALVLASRSAIEQDEKEKAKRKRTQRIWIGSAISVIVTAVIVATGFELIRRGEQIIALYDRWSGYTDPTFNNSESLETSINFLQKVEKRAEEAKKDNEIDRAIAYYRQIRAETSRLQEDYSINQDSQDRLSQLSQNSINHLGRLIIADKIQELEKALIQESKNKLFKGVLILRDTRDLGKGENQFPEGSALQITYKILMGNLGAKADFNNNGIIDDKIEAYQLPCDVLEKIQQLWEQATGQPCGWYDPKQLQNKDIAFTENPECDIFKNTTLLGQMIDISTAAIATERIYECPFVKQNLLQSKHRY